MRCVLCATERTEDQLKDLHTRDFRGQQLVVKICRDSLACITSTLEHRKMTPAEKRRALGAR